MTILFLINDPNYRNIIRLHLDLPKLFSIFTDVDLPLDSAKDKGGKFKYKKMLINQDREGILHFFFHFFSFKNSPIIYYILQFLPF